MTAINSPPLCRGGRIFTDFAMCNRFSKNLGLGDGSALPVGVPVPWPAATAPTGWLKCNGAAFTAAQYPKLAMAYPALVLPDLRAEFIRGWDDGRGIDSSRVLLSSQKGSIIPGDDGLSTPNVVGINNLLNNSALWGMDQATIAEITGCYIAVIASTNSSNTIQTNIAGISRPRNVAFNYIVRAA
nr:phage tail protein [Citrobacter freundii]